MLVVIDEDRSVGPFHDFPLRLAGLLSRPARLQSRGPGLDAQALAHRAGCARVAGLPATELRRYRDELCDRLARLTKPR
ncbi:MAG TPA: hypothetical protein VFY71_02955 [Planctomycetota bacterium]|nr:hypothetical protein [Planctomycetota bacterium]